MNNCILMVMAMTVGPPDWDCVPLKTCMWLQEKIVTGHNVKIAYGTPEHRHYKYVKSVKCLPSQKGQTDER